MARYIDLRSDTVTQPTDEMREAMAGAEVGDDVYRDDPTVNRFEALAAKMLGKDAALYVASGTMGNQVSIITHTRPGDEIIAGRNSHLIKYEAGAAARLGGLGYALADNPDYRVNPDDIRRLTRPGGDVHFPKTSLACFENALLNGSVVPLDELRAAAKTAHDLGLKVHLDGARIFNAAVSLGVDVKEIAACADSVMFCVSKGLCSPIGSLICGPSEFIEQARAIRKMFGGGMRQAGVLAACGIISLEKMTLRLKDDHDNARYLGEQLAAIPGITVETDRIRINMVFWKADIAGFAPAAFEEFLFKRGIKIRVSAAPEFRFVTHNGVTRQDVDEVISGVKGYIAGIG